MAGGGVGGCLARCHPRRRLHTVILVPASSYVLLPLLLLHPHALVTRRGSRQGHAGREHRPELGCPPLPRLSVRWKRLACPLDLLQQPTKRVGGCSGPHGCLTGC